MAAELLSPQDATLWNVQAPDAPLQIGGLSTFEAGPLRDASGELRLDELRRHVEATLGVVPRFRKRLVELPLDQGPALVDDQHFDIAHHVLLDDLPAPVSDRRLREHLRQLLATPLDPARPLWELRLVDGLDGDRVAVILRVSHVIVDGMGLLGFVVSLLDPRRSSAGDGGEDWRPAPGPGLVERVAVATVGRARRTVSSALTLGRGLIDPGLLASAAGALVRVGTGRAHAIPPLPVTRAVGCRRDVAWTRLDLDALVRAKRSQAVTLNDVVLAIVGDGLARYLERTGVPVGDRPPKVLVPVSTHGAAGGPEIENRFSMMVASVPLVAESPLHRLHAVHAEMEQHKRSHQSRTGSLLFSLGDLIPNRLLRAVGPGVLRRQPFANLAVTNLPGSRDPLFLLGARMIDVYPFITVIGNLALIIGVLSYRDGLGVSFTVDADVIADVDLLVESVELAAQDLVAACG